MGVNVGVPKHGPKLSRHGPKRSQNGPKRSSLVQKVSDTVQKVSKTVQHGPKMVQKSPKMAKTWPKMVKSGPESVPKWLKNGHRRAGGPQGGDPCCWIPIAWLYRVRGTGPSLRAATHRVQLQTSSHWLETRYVKQLPSEGCGPALCGLCTMPATADTHDRPRCRPLAAVPGERGTPQR